jgi:hypothetical protein
METALINMSAVQEYLMQHMQLLSCLSANEIWKWSNMMKIFIISNEANEDERMAATRTLPRSN